MRGPAYLSYNNDNGSFKLSLSPNIEDINTPFYLLTFGKMIKENNINLIDSRNIIIYSLKGKGEALIDGVWQPLEEGSAVYFSNDSPKTYRPAGDEDWSTIFFAFNGRFVLNTLGNKSFIAKDIDLSFVPDILEKLRSNYGNEDFTEYSSAILYYLILMLKKSAPHTDFDDLAPKLSDIVAKSIKHISENFTKDLPISEIAEVSGITKEYLSTVFKEETGQNCTSYINELRINHACALISHDPQKKIEDVCRECGFRTLTYFNRIFKQRMGVTPSEYRNKSY